MRTRAAHRPLRRARQHTRPTTALASTGLAVALLVAGAATATTATAAPGGGTSIIDWSFTTATAPADSTFLGRACLTEARPGSPRVCPAPATDRTGPGPVPVPSTNGDDGWLELTAATTGTGSEGVAGSLLYDKPIPASAGIVVTFDQVQYGGTGADGISFFLTDGTHQLTDTGAFGGSLGYAQRGPGANPTGARIEPGVAAGYLGVGLDAFGNYTNGEEARGLGCTSGTGGTGRIADAVALRGPGVLGDQPAWTGTSTYPKVDWVNGYCLLDSNPLPGLSLRSPLMVAPNPGNVASMQRRVKVSIAPQPADPSKGPAVQVDIDFGSGFVTVLDAVMPEPAPPTYKFGFAASTGGESDVHLVRNVQVDTIAPLDDLTLVKQVPSAGARVAGYVVGESVPYEYVVYNTGSTPVTALDIADPSLDGPAVCPTDHLDPGASTVCTGAHVVTADDLSHLVGSAAPGQPLVYSLPATAHGVAAGAPLVSAPSSAPVQLKAPRGSITTIATLDDTDHDGLADVGETVHWSYRVVGDPVVDLTDLTVVTADGTIVCGPFDLAHGAAHLCTDPSFVTVVSAADLASGTLSSTAWARATDGDGTVVTTAPSTASVPLAPAPPATPTPVPAATPTPVAASAATPTPVAAASTAAPVDELARTGTDLRLALIATGALVLGAVALVFSSRRRRA